MALEIAIIGATPASRPQLDVPPVTRPTPQTYTALSVVAPAGDHIRVGAKRLEIRRWRPDTLPLRDLLIVQNRQRLSSGGLSLETALGSGCLAQPVGRLPLAAPARCTSQVRLGIPRAPSDSTFCAILRRPTAVSRLSEDPDGVALALVDVVGVHPWREDELAASCATVWEPGWLAWELANVRALDPVCSAPARLRLYPVTLDSKT